MIVVEKNNFIYPNYLKRVKGEDEFSVEIVFLTVHGDNMKGCLTIYCLWKIALITLAEIELRSILYST